MATLLKAWFRECPDPLLGGVEPAWLARVAGMTDLEEVRLFVYHPCVVSTN